MKTITVEVTQEHIDSGFRSDQSCYTPVVLAIRDAMGLGRKQEPHGIAVAAWANNTIKFHRHPATGYMNTSGEKVVTSMPAVCVEFMDKFDDWNLPKSERTGAPFSFELEIDPEAVNALTDH